VDEIDDTMGRPHYLMGRIHQVTTSLTLRGNYTFSSRMGLQFYAQPFVSTGRYSEYKEAVNPQADDYGDRYHVFQPGEVKDEGGVRSVDRNGDGATDFSFDLADFNFRQLHTNLVFRWEYLPGSTLFLIWSHGRTSDPDITSGRYALGNDLSALLAWYLVLVRRPVVSHSVIRRPRIGPSEGDVVPPAMPLTHFFRREASSSRFLLSCTQEFETPDRRPAA